MTKLTSSETTFNDEELDALQAKLHKGDQMDGKTVNCKHDQCNCALLCDAADAITILREQLAEALETWPIWAVQIKDKLQRYGVDPGDEWNVAEQFEAWLDEAVSDETARADRAEQRVATLEAALAAQIEADAWVCDQMASSCDDAMEMASGEALEIKICVASFKRMAMRCASAIRNQTHDRTALDRMLAEHEVRLREAREISESEKIAIRNKALRDAAEICSSIRQRIANGPMPEGARFDYEQAILAMIDSE